MIWHLICQQCDHEWRVEIPDSFKSPDDYEEIVCPDCGSDDYEAEVPRSL